MFAPFESLEDRLLRGGIAPRHVKRYLRELDEHLSDITEAQAAAGQDAPTGCCPRPCRTWPRRRTGRCHAEAA